MYALVYILVDCILYRGKLSREKIFTNYTVLWLFAKAKFGGMVSFGTAKTSDLRKFFTVKIVFSPICESFLPQKFSAIW